MALRIRCRSASVNALRFWEGLDEEGMFKGSLDFTVPYLEEY